MTRRNIQLQLLICLALSTEATYIVMAMFDNSEIRIPVYLACYGAVFLIYWVAGLLFFNFRREGAKNTLLAAAGSGSFIRRIGWLSRVVNQHTSADTLSAREVVTVGVVFGVIFRLTLLFSPPTLSDDIYRYVWDGRVAAHGVNPYRFAPEAHELQSLRDRDIFPNINHREVSTIYPPVNQLTFRGIYELNPRIVGFKSAALGFDLLTICLLFLILRKLSMPLDRLLIYVWNPLVIVEFSGSGHIDSEGIFLLTLALWLFVERKLIVSTVVLALSFLTKYLALLLLPFYTFFKKENKLFYLLIFVIVAAVFYIPYANAREGLFSALLVYSSKWRFNDSLFALIFSTVHRLLPESWIVKLMILPYGMQPEPGTIATRGTDLALTVSKYIVSLAFAALFLFYFSRSKREFSKVGRIWMFKVGLVLFGTFFLLSPTVHPWYLCWMLPFLVLLPNRAWILLTGLVGLSYWALIDFSATGVWHENIWIKWLEYLPFYLLLTYDFLSRRFRSPGGKKSW
ncbi:MAG: hypothetical protein ACE5HO_18535 [bacterium]